VLHISPLVPCPDSHFVLQVSDKQTKPYTGADAMDARLLTFFRDTSEGSLEKMVASHNAKKAKRASVLKEPTKEPSKKSTVFSSADVDHSDECSVLIGAYLQKDKLLSLSELRSSESDMDAPK
jgi:hypothetical protein